ncbi:MAG: alcohol dehydrogenase catalytic domain-containing protein [Planctomycetia bacterium]|nr:alcohol dehydrogenase catalytic domain-containing protein [Planctomycetia bacterium]
MRAVVLGAESVTFTADYPAPIPAVGEVAVRVLCAGVCETDLQLVRGYMGFRGILGHEFVGVAESGPFRGRRVVGEINASCGTCELCRQGLANHCPSRSVLGILNRDGAFADVVCLPQTNLHPVPDEISTRSAVFTEPLAAAFQIPAQVPLRSGQKVVVLGDGRLGNLCAQVLAREGCSVTVVGKHARKLALLSQLGLATVPLESLSRERRADLVVDCTGSPTGLATALEIVRPRGTIVLKTTVAGPQTLSLAPVVIDEVTIVGSRCGPFPRALVALRERQIDVESLIDGVYPLEEATTALDRAHTEPVLKFLLAVDPSSPPP